MYVLDTGIKLDNDQALFAVLDRAFGDPDAVETATRAVRQRNNDLSTYVAEFSRLAAEVLWNDQAKLDQSQLRDPQQALINAPDVKTLDELIDQASRVEQKMTRLRSGQPQPPQPSRPSRSSPADHRQQILAGKSSPAILPLLSQHTRHSWQVGPPP